MQDNIGVIALGVVSLVIMVLYIVDKFYHERTVASLTNAVKDKASDAQLIALAHRMAIEVVSTDALAKILEAVKTGGEFVKALTPDDIDALVNAGVDLAGAIASGQPVTIADVVKAISATPATSKAA